MADTPIAFIGLGNMGLPMARRLLGAGRAVVGFDLTEPARSALREAGGEAVGTAAQAATCADIVILMLPNSAIVESVVDEIADALTTGKVVVDMSSSEPLRTRALAERLRERGIALIDAPVSGGVRGANAGTLTVMVGGDPAEIERARPVLECFGKVVVAGPIGAGHAAKSLNNLMSAVHFWATGEAVEVGRRFGIDPGTLIDIVNGSSGRSGSSEYKWPSFVLPGDFTSGFAATLMLKDVRIAVALAEGVGADAELARHTAQLWGRAVDDLGPAADHTEVGKWIADHQGGMSGD